MFCPFRASLPEVIELAHHLLDHIAKAATGRESLAAAVLKSGGVTCQWAAPWKQMANGDETVLDALVECLRGRELSSGFLFQIRERFAILTNDPLTSPGRFGCLPDGIEMKPLLLGEYRRARSHLTWRIGRIFVDYLAPLEVTCLDQPARALSIIPRGIPTRLRPNCRTGPTVPGGLIVTSCLFTHNIAYNHTTSLLGRRES